MCKKTNFPYKLQQKRNLNCQGWEIDKWKKKKERKKHSLLESSHLLHFRFDVAEGGRGDSRETTLNFQVNRSSWRAKLLLLPIKGMISGAWTRVLRTVFFFFFLFFFKAARFNEERGEKREGWGIYSRRGVFFTLPATSARIDQLFIGRESGSTSLEERASWLEWIKGNSSGNYVDFSIFFPPWFVASFLLPLLINLR